MTQPQVPEPSPYGQTNVFITPQPSNGLGVAGFVTSLVGILSCGLLSPIGLLLSFMALFRRPRGFAVAGVVIGACGSVLMALWGLGFALLLIGVKEAVPTAAESFLTRDRAARASAMVEKLKLESGELPGDSVGTQLIATQLDAWNNAFRYHKTGEDSYLIISSGRDGEFDTDDDSAFDSQTFRDDRPRFRPTSGPSRLPDNSPAQIPTH